MTDDKTLVSFSNVSLSYGDKLILRDINLTIKNIIGYGQVTTLLGKSGSGKSTLFKILAGLLPPTTGEVRIGEAQELTEAGKVGLVLQSYPLFAHRTVYENMKLVCKKDNEQIDIYLNEFDIFDHKKKYPRELSGGQRQRAAIVQQLLCSEHFTLLDEPFSGLDPVATDKLCNVITKVANMDEYNTVIISSHILEPAIAISDSIWVLGHQYQTLLSHDKDNNEIPGETIKVPGATILRQENLAAQGLAWNSEIRKTQAFATKVDEVRELFKQI